MRTCCWVFVCFSSFSFTRRRGVSSAILEKNARRSLFVYVNRLVNRIKSRFKGLNRLVNRIKSRFNFICTFCEF
jgi:hypothetical protein